MTINLGEGVVVGNTEGLFNVRSASEYCHPFNSEVPNMMRPMPFSGYPFQGKIFSLLCGTNETFNKAKIKFDFHLHNGILYTSIYKYT